MIPPDCGHRLIRQERSTYGNFQVGTVRAGPVDATAKAALARPKVILTR